MTCYRATYGKKIFYFSFLKGTAAHGGICLIVPPQNFFVYQSKTIFEITHLTEILWVIMQISYCLNMHKFV